MEIESYLAATCSLIDFRKNRSKHAPRLPLRTGGYKLHLNKPSFSLFITLFQLNNVLLATGNGSGVIKRETCKGNACHLLLSNGVHGRTSSTALPPSE